MAKHILGGILLSFIVLLIPSTVFCQTASDSTAPKTDLGGYIKYLSSASGAPGLDGILIDNLIHNRVNFTWYPHKKWTVKVELRNRLFYGNQLSLIPNYGALIDQYNGLLDLSVLWANNNQFVLHSVVDRLNVEYLGKKTAFRLGRQRINWGINTVWNPNDLFNAFNYLDFDYEERPGSDAARFTWYTGTLSSFDVAVAPDTQLNQSVMAARYRFNFKTYDIQFIGGYSRGDVVTGLGWTGYIKDAGFKGEASYFIPTQASNDTSSALVASIALDRQFGSIYLSLAGLYNGATAAGAPDLAALSGQAGIAAQGVSVRSLFPSRWATVAVAQKQLSPLSSGSIALIYSPNGDLVIGSPTFTLSVAQDWDLDLIGQTFFASNGQQWGHLGTSAFFRIRYSY